MLTLNNQPQHFMGGDTAYEDARWIMVGMPYDGTTSYRPGTRFGPNGIREASWGTETYSPLQDRDLENVRYHDWGDLELPFGNRDKSLKIIEDAATQVLADGKRWVGFGGEHLVTYPVVQAYLRQYPDLAVVHFDAHADLRDDYLGEELSHATVMRRIVNQIGPERLAQIGIRSGPKSEFDWMRANNTLMQSHEQLKTKLQGWGNRPVFLTIDLDVLDPCVLPGTGTPEPGGFLFTDFLNWLYLLQDVNIVGLDAVELSPPYDASGCSNVVAAKAVREALLLNMA